MTAPPDARMRWHSPRLGGAIAGAGCLLLALIIIAQSLLVPSCRGPVDATAHTPTTLDEPVIRVRVLADVTRIELDGSAQLTAHSPATAPIRLTPPVALEAVDGRLVAHLPRTADETHRPGTSRPAPLSLPFQAPVELSAQSGPAPPVLMLDHRPYRGRLQLVPRTTGGSFDVVELVPIESYVAGVVAREVYADWPMETLRVQAICARSYALHERQRAHTAGRHYDVETTTADQAYAGWTASSRARQAAESTRGIVLTFRGRILRTYYSSTCGGRSASAADTWPTGPGYEFNLDAPIQAHARAHACRDSPRYRWLVRRGRDELTQRLLASLRDSSPSGGAQLVSIHAVRTNAAGRPSRFEILFSDGRRATLTGEQLRLACNADVPGLSPLAGDQRLFSSDVHVLVQGDAVTIEGRGFGHGVGMCQYCARGFAQAGRSWRAMLELFYPGARVERAYR